VPPCCCCNDIYTGLQNPQGLGRVQVRGDDSTLKDSLTNTASGYTIPRGHMDFKNKRFWGLGVVGSGGDFFNTAEDFSDLQVLISVSSSFLRDIWPSPVSGYIFYSTSPTPSSLSGTITRCLYDGTGSTTLVTHSHATTSVALSSLAASKSQSYLFYTLEYGIGVAGLKEEVRRINFDGTGDTLIFQATNDTQNNHSVTNVYVDETHQKVMFEYEFPSGQVRLNRCDFDGSNQETYYSGTTTTGIPVRTPFWSHKHQKYFFYKRNADPVSGLFSLEYDGSNLTQEVPIANWAGQLSPLFIAPGCGMEITGSGYTL